MNSIHVAAVGSKAAKQHQYHMAVTTDKSHKDNANKVQSLHLGIYWAVPPAPEFQLEVVHLLAAVCPLQVHVASNKVHLEHQVDMWHLHWAVFCGCSSAIAVNLDLPAPSAENKTATDQSDGHGQVGMSRG